MPPAIGRLEEFVEFFRFGLDERESLLLFSGLDIVFVGNVQIQALARRNRRAAGSSLQDHNTLRRIGARCCAVSRISVRGCGAAMLRRCNIDELAISMKLPISQYR